MSQELSFNKYSIHDILLGQPDAMKKRVQSIPANTILNASEQDLVQAVVEEFRLLVGIVLAGVSSRVLRSFLFDVQPSDPRTLVIVGALFVGVALLACWVPGRRAATVDPLEAQRYE